MEEAQHVGAFLAARTLRAADQLVVGHAAVGQRDRAPRPHPQAGTEAQTRTEHQRVEQIAFEAQVRRYRAVVERARQRRHEVDATGQAALQEAAARHLDHDL
jgi:arginine utilization protein RocB